MTVRSRPSSSLAAVTDLLDLQAAPAGDAAADRTRLGVVSDRFLVPVGFPDATAEACLAYLGLRDARTRVTRGAVGLALKARLARVVIGRELTAATGPGSLLAHLDDLLHDPDEEPGLAVGVGLGSIDEVWKPTLQVFRPDGTPAAFVKIGLGPVADRLVATEAATLRAWARDPDPRLVVPDLIAETTWDGIRIAVVAPLPADVRRLPLGAPSAWAVRQLDGTTTATPFDAPWWTDRRTACADQPAVDRLLDRVAERHDGDEHEWARWHGDWVPWNLARCHRGLVAWDWEYSEPGAPVGLDEVHGAYQHARVVQGRPIAEALTTARRGATAWQADAHVAMLITRSAELERLGGSPPADQPELLTAAAAAIGAGA
ncbi:hypothetical protein [Aquihabitans sp. McL0605]|uniref:hypothetical protein n=1 Tax=Aquihabitans sp. McL0605 TaxID=3415671 RepID=UPI003CFB1324